MNARWRPGERGSALLMSVVLVVVLLGLSAAMLIRSISDSRNMELAVMEARAIAIAEAGAHAGWNSLTTGGTGVVGASRAPVDYHSGNYYTEVYDAVTPANGSKAIVARSAYSGQSRGIEVVVTPVTANFAYAARAGITTRSPVQTLGNFTADGRDWNSAGTAIVGAGTYGISSMSTIAVGGSSAVGGHGVAPTGSPSAGVQIEPNAVWPTGYPPGPDQALGLTAGTLKTLAIASGTYCVTSAQWSALLSANGGKCPSGKIIYLEMNSIVPLELGSALNENASIFVLHNNTSTAYGKNLHGYFKGLMLIDDIDHVNAGTLILGAIMTFRPTTGGNAFGNGNAYFKYSSSVLAGLPANPAASAWNLVSWREFPAYLTGKPPAATGGATFGGF
ncbi:MAG: hypothetical protein HZA54_19110 [Planctomycetes bacterium]|nr:hypothetical protein [Planctomycetota bacterium]